MKQLRLFPFLFATLQILLAVDDEFCSGRKHYTGQGFTCCNSQKFNAPKTNPFEMSKEELKTCLDSVDGEEKLVRRLWLLYKCMLEKEVKDISIDSFADHMAKRFSDNIKQEIKKTVDSIKADLPKKARRKRNSRVRRDEGDDATTVADVGEPDAAATEAEAIADETTAAEAQPADTNESTTDMPNQDGGVQTEADAPPEATEEPGQETNDATTAAAAEPEGGGAMETDAAAVPEATDPPPPPPVEEKDPPPAEIKPRALTVYNYLSVFEYFDKFKKHIPDEDLLRSWDVYYVAEFVTCHRLAADTEEVIKSYGSERCLSWFQRTSRDAECCNEVPIPMPIYSYPVLDREEIQNNTAINILSLAGKYTWTNLTYSSNIDRCRRLSIAMLQGQTNSKDLLDEITQFLEGKKEKPDYKQIAEKLIPSHFKPTLKEKIITTVLAEGQKRRDDGQRDIYEDIDLDSDIQKIRSWDVSIYQFAVASEWEKPHEIENKSRYLMWTCDVYTMISQRIKYFDVTPFCY